MRIDRIVRGGSRVLVAGAVLLAGGVSAQTPPVPGAGDILREQQLKPPSAPTTAPGLQLEAPPRPALKSLPGLRLRVNAFRISGNTLIPEQELLPLLKSYVDRELELAQLEQAAQVVTLYYRGKGFFLAQAYLPEQTVKGGVIEIAVLEGRLGEIRINRAPGVRVQESLARGIIERSTRPGDVVTQSAIERGLLLLNDLPGTAVEGALEAGTVVGTTDLTVDLNTVRVFSGYAAVDNYGSRFSGENRLSTNVAIANALGMGDQLSVGGSVATASLLQSASVAYSLPVNYSGTRLGVGYSSLNYRLGQQFAPLLARGSADVGSANLQHPFIRSRTLNLYGRLGYERKLLQDRQEATAFVNDRVLTNWSAGLSTDGRDSFWGGGLNYGGLVFTRGDVRLDTPAIAAADASPGGRGISGSSTVTTFMASRAQAVSGPLSAFASIRGQLASKNLDSAEKFSLGGPFGVRAYPASEAAADEGYVVNAELRWDITAAGQRNSLTVAGFYDYGEARLNRDPSPTDIGNTTHRAGYGVGVNWSRAGVIAIRSSLAWRSSQSSTADPTGDRRPRVFVQAVTYF